jgi:hypothetical protein
MVYAPHPRELFRSGYLSSQVDPARTAREHAVGLIPANASVSATNHLGSHLSARRDIYSFPLVEPADWIVVDREDTWMPVLISSRRPPTKRSIPPIEGFERPLRMTETIRALREDPRWQVVFDSEGIMVFRRLAASTPAQ